MNDRLTAEERAILERFERGELRSALDAEREIGRARQAALSTLDKTRRVRPQRQR